MYVNLIEATVIIGAILVAAILILLNRSLESGGMFKLAIFSFVFCYIFGVIDILIDHYLYFNSEGNVDGKALTIGLKLEEFSDDLFLLGIASMAILVISAFILNKVTPKLKAEKI